MTSPEWTLRECDILPDVLANGDNEKLALDLLASELWTPGLPKGQLAQQVARSLNQGQVYIATDNTEAFSGVAHVKFRPDGSARLSGLAVPADKRRQGLGTFIVGELADIARADACRMMELTIPPELPDKDGVRNFFQQVGFVAMPLEFDGGRMVLDLLSSTPEI